MKDVENIPNGNGRSLSLSYNVPFKSSTTTATINSNFPNILGNRTVTTSLVGKAYKDI